MVFLCSLLSFTLCALTGKVLGWVSFTKGGLNFFVVRPITLLQTHPHRRPKSQCLNLISQSPWQTRRSGIRWTGGMEKNTRTVGMLINSSLLISGLIGQIFTISPPFRVGFVVVYGPHRFSLRPGCVLFVANQWTFKLSNIRTVRISLMECFSRLHSPGHCIKALLYCPWAWTTGPWSDEHAVNPTRNVSVGKETPIRRWCRYRWFCMGLSSSAMTCVVCKFRPCTIWITHRHPTPGETSVCHATTHKLWLHISLIPQPRSLPPRTTHPFPPNPKMASEVDIKGGNRQQSKISNGGLSGLAKSWTIWSCVRGHYSTKVQHSRRGDPSSAGCTASVHIFTSINCVCMTLRPPVARRQRGV